MVILLYRLHMIVVALKKIVSNTWNSWSGLLTDRGWRLGTFYDLKHHYMIMDNKTYGHCVYIKSISTTITETTIRHLDLQTLCSSKEWLCRTNVGISWYPWSPTRPLIY